MRVRRETRVWFKRRKWTEEEMERSAGIILVCRSRRDFFAAVVPLERPPWAVRGTARNGDKPIYVRTFLGLRDTRTTSL